LPSSRVAVGRSASTPASNAFLVSPTRGRRGVRGARDPPSLLLVCVDLVLSEVMGLLNSVSATALQLLPFRTHVFSASTTTLLC
jgi:hypothetical protein